MRGTVRLIADVDPEIKEKVKEIAELEEATIKDVLVTAVNDLYSKVKEEK